MSKRTVSVNSAATSSSRRAGSPRRSRRRSITWRTVSGMPIASTATVALQRPPSRTSVPSSTRCSSTSRMKNGLPLVSSRDRGDQWRGHLLIADQVEQLLHRGRVEAGERDLLVARLARQRAEGVAQRVLAVDLDVAIGAEDEQSPAPGKARHVAQHRHGPVIGPVQIVDYHHRRRAGRQREEELHHGVEQPDPLFVRLQRHRARADRGAARAAPAPFGSAGRRRARGRPAASRPAHGGRTRSAPRRRGRTVARPRPRSSGPRAQSPPRRAPSPPAPPACGSCRCPPRLPATPRRRGRRGHLSGVGRGGPAPPCGRRTASASAAPPARPAGTAPRTPRPVWRGL